MPAWSITKTRVMFKMWTVEDDKSLSGQPLIGAETLDKLHARLVNSLCGG